MENAKCYCIFKQLIHILLSKVDNIENGINPYHSFKIIRVFFSITAQCIGDSLNCCYIPITHAEKKKNTKILVSIWNVISVLSYIPIFAPTLLIFIEIERCSNNIVTLNIFNKDSNPYFCWKYSSHFESLT